MSVCCRYMLQPHRTALVALSFGAMGFMLLPMLPVSLEAAVECTCAPSASIALCPFGMV